MLASRSVRTTINIDDDILLAAKELARRGGTSIGSVISDLARKGLNGSPHGEATASEAGFFGFVPLPMRGGTVTNELIDRLREGELH